jgi:hypothetical protein
MLHNNKLDMAIREFCVHYDYKKTFAALSNCSESRIMGINFEAMFEKFFEKEKVKSNRHSAPREPQGDDQVETEPVVEAIYQPKAQGKLNRKSIFYFLPKDDAKCFKILVLKLSI